MEKTHGLVARSVSLLASIVIASQAFAAIPEPPPAPTVDQSVPTVSYGAGAISKAALAPTDKAPKASGAVKAKAKGGTAELAISVKGLPAATSFGPEFLTYVVWAVAPEGRPRNLGEIVTKKGSGSLAITTQMSEFGLVVTAEPYFAAGAPSEIVVLQNKFSEKDLEGASPVDAAYKTFPKSIFAGGGAEMPDLKKGPPLDVYQARNAVRVADRFGAQNFAAEPRKRATDALSKTEEYWRNKKQRKLAPAKAREAVQAAEAARAAAVRSVNDARVAGQQAEAAERAKQAQDRANAAQAEAARAQAEAARSQAEAARSQAEAARSQADALQANATAAEEARRRGAAETAAAQAELLRRQAEEEKQALRARLLTQLNLILETRDSARGLIVNLGDVLFDVNKFTLRSEAREKLAKLSGVVLGNPGLLLAVEGHTDSTGSDELNQKLSDNRAGSVRDYLVTQGVSAESVSAQGFGKTRPVAPNETSEGRQKNRRVDIVVSGDVIGTGAPAN